MNQHWWTTRQVRFTYLSVSKSFTKGIKPTWMSFMNLPITSNSLASPYRKDSRSGLAVTGHFCRSEKPRWLSHPRACVAVRLPIKEKRRTLSHLWREHRQNLWRAHLNWFAATRFSPPVDLEEHAICQSTHVTRKRKESPRGGENKTLSVLFLPQSTRAFFPRSQLSVQVLQIQKSSFIAQRVKLPFCPWPDRHYLSRVKSLYFLWFDHLTLKMKSINTNKENTN